MARVRLAFVLGFLLVFGAAATHALAETGDAGKVSFDRILPGLASTAAFGLVGTLLAIGGFRLFDWISPFDLEEEICKNQNQAAAILCGSMILGISIIVAAAVV